MRRDLLAFDVNQSGDEIGRVHVTAGVSFDAFDQDTEALMANKIHTAKSCTGTHAPQTFMFV